MKNQKEELINDVLTGLLVAAAFAAAIPGMLRRKIWRQPVLRPAPAFWRLSFYSPAISPMASARL
jgi:hypothetical protein